MLFFFHFLIGLIIGIILKRIYNTKWIIPICAFMSLLPDIIDKPLSLISNDFNSGRTICHTILFVILTMIILIPLIKKHKIIYCGIIAAISFHQLCDSMWNYLITWMFPYYGPFVIITSTSIGNWFWNFVWLEVSSYTEWLSGIISVIIIVLYIYYNKGERL